MTGSHDDKDKENPGAPQDTKLGNKAEQKEKESKHTLPKAQREVLAQFVAPPEHSDYPDGGLLTTSILEQGIESKSPNLGIRLLYLERAMTQNPTDFNASLDKLYSPNLATEEEKTAQLNLFRNYKFINNICCNGEMKLVADAPSVQWMGIETSESTQQNFGTVSVIKQTFERLGNAVNTNHIMSEAKNMVKANIEYMEEKNKDNEKDIVLQIEARLEAEKKITPQTQWRSLLDLPPSELKPSSSSANNLPNAQTIVMGDSLTGTRRSGNNIISFDWDRTIFGNTSSYSSFNSLVTAYNRPVTTLINRRNPEEQAAGRTGRYNALYRHLQHDYPTSLVTDIPIIDEVDFIWADQKDQKSSSSSTSTSNAAISTEDKKSSPATAAPAVAPHATMFQPVSEDAKAAEERINQRINYFIQNGHISQQDAHNLNEEKRKNLDGAYLYIINGHMTAQFALGLEEHERNRLVAAIANSAQPTSHETMAAAVRELEFQRLGLD